MMAWREAAWRQGGRTSGCQVTEDGSLDGGDGCGVSYLSAPVTYLAVGVRGVGESYLGV